MSRRTMFIDNFNGYKTLHSERYTTVKGVEKIHEHTLRLDVRKGQIIQANNHRVYVDCGNGTSLLHIYNDREIYQKGKPTWTYV